MPLDAEPSEPPARRGPLRLVSRGLAIIVAAAFIALLAYGVIAQAPDTTIDDSLAEGLATAAPAFELDILHSGDLGQQLGGALREPMRDGRIGLDELRGTPVVLNLWASWCVPCREEAPLLQQGWRRLARPRGVLMLGLDMQDVPEDARDFIREFRITYPNIRDPSNTIARRYGMTGIPETFFISRAGRVVGHVIGVVAPAQLAVGVKAAASGRPIGADTGGAQRPVR
jgi:cytochrome c biogenesis protein CcmG/thiol:disulfide interchange protein DsbE